MLQQDYHHNVSFFKNLVHFSFKEIEYKTLNTIHYTVRFYTMVLLV